MDLDISLSGEEAERCAQRAIVTFLSAINSLKELIFVKSLFESLKVSQLQALVLVWPPLLHPSPTPVYSASLLAAPPPPHPPHQLGSLLLWTTTISVIMLTGAEASAAKSGLLSEAADSCGGIFELITLKAVGFFRNHPPTVMTFIANLIKKSLSTFTCNPDMQHWAASF